MAVLPVQIFKVEGDQIDVSGVVGVFQPGEGLSFAPSGARGIFISEAGGKMRYEPIIGLAAVADTVTGEASGATATMDSFDDNAMAIVWGNSVAGDEMPLDDRSQLWVENTTLGAVFFYPKVQRASSHGTKLSGVRRIPVGIVPIGPFSRHRYANAAGNLEYSLSTIGANVRVAVVRLERAVA